MNPVGVAAGMMAAVSFAFYNVGGHEILSRYDRWIVLMYTTLSAEGSDTFDALSRSYNYVYESPWYYIWYGIVSVFYGAAVIFFVVCMSSLMVYLGKWGVSQTPFTKSANRSPEYLFIYSPTSFGWRELMLKGSPVEITPDRSKAGLNAEGKPVEPIDGYWYTDPDAASKYMQSFYYSNYFGAGMVSFWMSLLFMMMLGFSYSFFWTQASMIYLLMRKKVDEVEVDDVLRTVRSLVRERVMPLETAIDETDEMPAELRRLIEDLGARCPDAGRGRKWAPGFPDRVLLAYRTNLTMLQLAALFGISDSAVHRVLDRLVRVPS